MPLPMYMKQIGNTLYYYGDGELIYYVPQKYFDLNITRINGEYVETIGIFRYCNFSNSGKADKVRDFKCPTMIRCKPSFIEKINNFQLEGTKEPNSYQALKFRDNDELICELEVSQDIANVEKFMNLLIRGNLPDHIPYNELHEYMIMNAQANGFNYKVSNQIMGMVISELCRNEKNLSEPFRYTDMNDMKAYKMITITKVPKYTSPYTAITSENPDEAIAGALITTGTGQSPLEKVMMNQNIPYLLEWYKITYE